MLLRTMSCCVATVNVFIDDRVDIPDRQPQFVSFMTAAGCYSLDADCIGTGRSLNSREGVRGLHHRVHADRRSPIPEVHAASKTHHNRFRSRPARRMRAGDRTGGATAR